MTDAIRGIGATDQATEISAPVNSKKQTAVDPSGSNPGTDSANISQTQSLLETINSTSAEIPLVDQAQVSSIRNAIANGTYQVNPQQIARQLLKSDQSLTGTSSSE